MRGSTSNENKYMQADLHTKQKGLDLYSLSFL